MIRLLFSLVLASVLAAATPAAAKRVGLVVGNSAYAYVAPLANPKRDAAAVAEVLWQAGFEVIEVLDADLGEMKAAVAAFASRLEPGDVALFYYAGHAVQVRNLNLILPVSVHPATIDDLVAQSISAQAVIDLVDAAGASIKIALLDACRNNPFGDLSVEQARAIAKRGLALADTTDEGQIRTALKAGTSGGLSEMSALGGETLIGFATAPGEVALDGDGANSPYTAALVENLATSGIDVATALGRVSADVRTATGGQQTSWTVSTLQTPFRFLPTLENVRESTTGMTGASANVLGRLPPRRVVDAAVWQTINGSDDPSAYRGYLSLLPEGAHAAEARTRLEQLGGQAPEPPLAFLPPIDPPPAPADTTVGTAEPASSARPMAIGVGTAALDVAPALASGQWVHLPVDTRLGQIRLGEGGALRGGDVAWLSAGERVDYEPLTGSNGGEERIALDLLGEAGSREALERPLTLWVHACDLLAGFEHDTQRVTAGARQFLVDRNHEAAIAVCEIAVRDYPEVPRFWAELARAYRSAGRYEDARDWYQRAADAGYMQAVVNLGQMYLDGQAVEKSTPRALDLFESAAAADEPRAYTALAAVYRYGLGVPQDLERALELQRRAAAAGVDWAMTNIAEHYLLGLGVEKDVEAAVQWLTRAAKSGELTAQTRLARMYQVGEEVPVDYDQARFWFETAAAQDVPNAFTRLGLMHESGQGVPEDLDLALRYYTHAARGGDGEGLFRLGDLYAAGRGVPRDTVVAARLLTLSIGTGTGGAERSLARLYATGDGVARSEAEALRLYAIAAESNPWAARDAGRLLLHGEQLEHDPDAAIGWLERAAQGGVHLAALDLATLYRDGAGVPPDPVAVVVWAAVAAAQAPPAAGEARAEAVGLIDAADEPARIAALQHFLNRHGLDVGPPDGAAGARTWDALSALAGRLGFAVAPGAVIDADLLIRVARP